MSPNPARVVYTVEYDLAVLLVFSCQGVLQTEQAGCEPMVPWASTPIHASFCTLIMVALCFGVSWAGFSHWLSAIFGPERSLYYCTLNLT